MIEKQLQRLMHGGLMSHSYPLLSMVVILDNRAEIQSTFGQIALERLRGAIVTALCAHVRCTDRLTWRDDRLVLSLPGLAGAEAQRVVDRVRAALPTSIGLGGLLIRLQVRVRIEGVGLAA